MPETIPKLTRRHIHILYAAVLLVLGLLVPAVTWLRTGPRILEGQFIELASPVAAALAGCLALYNVRWQKAKHRIPWVLMGLGLFVFTYMELDNEKGSPAHIENYISTLLIVLAASVVVWPIFRDMKGMGISRHLLVLGILFLLVAQMSDARVLGYAVYDRYTVIEETCELLAGCSFLLTHLEVLLSKRPGLVDG